MDRTATKRLEFCERIAVPWCMKDFAGTEPPETPFFRTASKFRWVGGFSGGLPKVICQSTMVFSIKSKILQPSYLREASELEAHIPPIDSTHGHY